MSDTRDNLNEQRHRRFAEIGGGIIAGGLVVAAVIATAGVIVLAFRFLFWTIGGAS